MNTKWYTQHLTQLQHFQLLILNITQLPFKIKCWWDKNDTKAHLPARLTFPASLTDSVWIQSINICSYLATIQFLDVVLHCKHLFYVVGCDTTNHPPLITPYFWWRLSAHLLRFGDNCQQRILSLGPQAPPITIYLVVSWYFLSYWWLNFILYHMYIFFMNFWHVSHIIFGFCTFKLPLTYFFWMLFHRILLCRWFEDQSHTFICKNCYLFDTI